MQYNGPATYIANEDIQPYTLVRVVPLTASEPPAVEPVNLTFPAIGISVTGAYAGHPITINPLNTAGYQQVRCESVGAIEVGQILYVTDHGTVTDIFTGGSSAGRSLNQIPAGVTTVVTVGASGGGGFNRAEDLVVTDSGNYYGSTPKNAEAYLEAAAGILAPTHVTKHVYAQEMLFNTLPQDLSILGGHPWENTGFDVAATTRAITNPEWFFTYRFTGAAVVTATAVVDVPYNIVIGPTHPMTIDMVYRHTPIPGSSLSVTTRVYGPGYGLMETSPDITIPSTVSQVRSMELFNSVVIAMADVPMYRITLTITTPAAQNPLQIRGLILNFAGKLNY